MLGAESFATMELHAGVRQTMSKILSCLKAYRRNRRPVEVMVGREGEHDAEHRPKLEDAHVFGLRLTVDQYRGEQQNTEKSFDIHII